MSKPSTFIRLPSLARRQLELQALALPGAQTRLLGGRELIYTFNASPSEFGRIYRCRLRLTLDARMPEVFVLTPDLKSLAATEKIPHVYPHTGPETKLCLWWPKRREWMPQLGLTDTIIPWTVQWLWYFEDWLFTGEWEGGGAPHPEKRPTLIQRFTEQSRKKERVKGQTVDDQD